MQVLTKIVLIQTDEHSPTGLEIKIHCPQGVLHAVGLLERAKLALLSAPQKDAQEIVLANGHLPKEHP